MYCQILLSNSISATPPAEILCLARKLIFLIANSTINLALPQIKYLFGGTVII